MSPVRLLLLIAGAVGLRPGNIPAEHLARSRRHVFCQTAVAILSMPDASRAIIPLEGVGDVLSAAQRASKVTYSSNAKNFARMGDGDYSMGRKDTSTSERAQKRRAAAACKSPKALREASIANEAECTKRVLGGDTQVMLSALERLGPACKADATHVCQ
jgi:hypothetical protein